MSIPAEQKQSYEELERELAAAKAEAEELRKEIADRPSIGMVQLLKQTIKAEHDEAEALREDAERYRWLRLNNGDLDAAIDAARKG